MPTNLEQARAEVESLFASNPSLVLDPSMSHSPIIGQFPN